MLSPFSLPREGGFIGNVSSWGLDQCSQFTSQKSGASVLSCWKQPLGWRTPAVILLSLSSPGAWGPAGGPLAGRVLADLLSLGGTQCCSVVGDIRDSSHDLEAFFIYIFQVRNILKDPLASNPELVPSQSPSGAPDARAWHGWGSALLL